MAKIQTVYATGSPYKQEEVEAICVTIQLDTPEGASHLVGAVQSARADIATAERRIPQIERDLEIRVPTKGDAFVMQMGDRTFTEREKAGPSLLSKLRIMEKDQDTSDFIIGRIGGFDLRAAGTKAASGWYFLEFLIERTGYLEEVRLKGEQSGIGLIATLEYRIAHFEDDLTAFRMRLSAARRRLAEYEPRLGESFPLQLELDAKEEQLLALNRDLASNAAPANDDAEKGEAA